MGCGEEGAEFVVAYTLSFRPAALRGLTGLPQNLRQRVSSSIDGLKQNPHPPGVKKLSGYENFWRIRIGDYRVVYLLDDGNRLVRILSVGHRREIYREY
jgi:mRNA interferase RelE/StbE